MGIIYDESVKGGGLKAGGLLRFTIFTWRTGKGGVVAAGQAPWVKVLPWTAKGGARLGGGVTPNVVYNVKRLQQGLRAGGAIRNNANYPPITASGGAVVAGRIRGGISRTEFLSGGVVVSGTGKDQKYSGHIATGGIVVSGAVKKEDPRYHYPNAPGLSTLVTVGGTGGPFTNKYRCVAEGGVVMGGGLSASGGGGLKSNYKFVSTGKSADAPPDFSGVTVGYQNNLNPTKVNMKFGLGWDFVWRKNQSVDVSFDFAWNTGKVRQYWYRVIGKGKPNECDPIDVGDPCCQKFIMNIHARSVEDLCRKLKERKWKWPIELIQRFRKPAENGAVNEDEQGGINYDCNVADNVDFCSNVICQDFCIDFDIVESWGGGMTAAFNAFTTYFANGSIFIGGGGDYALRRNGVDFRYEGTGSISVSGTAKAGSTGYSYTATGGVTVENGGASVKTTRFRFLGGDWPLGTNYGPGTKVDQFDETADDASWLVTSRIFKSDDLYTQADLSWGKKSKFLVIKGFNINVPANANILGVVVDIERASNSFVRDSEVYLVVGDEIVSDNKAKDYLQWPIGADSTVGYGGLFDNWRDPNDPDYLGPWDTADINDPEFGVAIRVKPDSNTSNVRAFIDYVRLVVIYEQPEHQVLRIGGSAGVRSSRYSYQGTGGLTLTGQTKLRVNRRVINTGRGSIGPEFTSIVIGGTYGRNFKYAATGGLTTGGTGDRKNSVYTYEAEGGVTLGSNNRVKSSNFKWAATGGVDVESSKALIRARYRYRNTSGGVTMAGEVSPANARSYTATGSLALGGESRVRSSAFKWVSDGIGIAIGGGNGYKFSDFGTLETIMGMSAKALNLLVVFGSDTSGPGTDTTNPLSTMIPPSETLTQCQCSGLPLAIPISHTILRDNKLTQFAKRNNITIPNLVNLLYNKANDSWQANFHYKGFSATSNTRETWMLVFELQCTDIVGGVAIGQKVWKFSIRIVQKNLTTFQDFDTRIVIGFLPDPICTRGNDFRVKMTLDTQMGMITMVPDATVYQSVLYDNIGLFKTLSWENNPDLVINMSQAGISTNPPRYPINIGV